MDRALAQITVASPLGPLTVSERDGRIVRLRWGTAKTERETPLLAAAAQQLNAYFYCGLKRFDLPVEPQGAEFERRVWGAMSRIPYGRTRSYGEIARELEGDPRDVGGACASNPIPVLIPCHRVLAGGGRMGGYSGKGGIETKTFLLQLEGALLL